MTDAFDAASDFSPAQNFSNDDSFAKDTFTSEPEQPSAPMTDGAALVEPEVQDVPNGFVTLGLAPELIAAVKDLGFTQPTTVQLKTIPLAMQGAPGSWWQ